METLSFAECDAVGGGSVVSLLGLALALVNDAGPVRSFFDGLFDGMGGI